MSQYVFVIFQIVLFMDYRYVSSGYTCYGVCYCERPKVICNLAERYSIPKLYHLVYHDIVEIFGNSKLSEIRPGTFTSGIGIREVSIMHTNISSLPCTDFTEISKSVQTLRLIGNAFTEIPRCALGEFTEVRYLYVNKCFIRSLRQDDFSKMRKLQVFDLSWNMISDIDVLSFADNPDLKRLILRGNKLTRLKRQQFQSLGSPYLDMVDLSYNQIESISSESFGGIGGRLFGLDLSYNRITQISWRAVVNELSVFPSLVTLNVSGNALLEIEQTLPFFSRLRTFEAAGCSLTQFDVKKFRQIRSLNASNNGLVINEVVFDDKDTLCSEVGTIDQTKPKCPPVSLDVSQSEVNTVNITTAQSMSLMAENSGIEHVDVIVKTKQCSNGSGWKRIVLLLGNNRLKGPLNIYVDRNKSTCQTGSNFALDFNDNQINRGLEDIVKVHLSDPEDPGLYKTLDPCDFRNHSIHIQALDLSGNGILEIPSGSCFISQVETLKLNRNNIRVLNKLSLEGSSPQLSRIRVIELRQNLIQSIGNQVFQGLPNLEVVDLRGNSLKTLPEMMYLQTLGSFRMMAVDDNPISCDCNLAWIPAYSNFIPNDPHYNRITGRCSSPTSYDGFSLSCYSWQSNCVNRVTSRVTRERLARVCEADKFIILRNFSLTLESDNSGNVRVEWTTAGPGVLYGSRISYRSNTSTPRELFVSAPVFSTTLYSLIGGESYTICLTPVLSDAILKDGQSYCEEITPGTYMYIRVSSVIIGLSLGLAVVVVLLIIVVVCICRKFVNLRCASEDNYRSSYLNPLPSPPGVVTCGNCPNYDDTFETDVVYETAE